MAPLPGDIRRPRVRRVGLEEQRHRLAVVGDGELDLLRSQRGDGHELADDVDLVASEVRNARVRRLDDELQPLRPLVAVRKLLVGQLEETAGEELGHFDIEADELAIGVLIVPWRVGRAGADDELAAVEHLLQAALRRILGQRRVRRKALRRQPPRRRGPRLLGANAAGS